MSTTIHTEPSPTDKHFINPLYAVAYPEALDSQERIIFNFPHAVEQPIASASSLDRAPSPAWTTFSQQSSSLVDGNDAPESSLTSVARHRLASHNLSSSPESAAAGRSPANIASSTPLTTTAAEASASPPTSQRLTSPHHKTTLRAPSLPPSPPVSDTDEPPSPSTIQDVVPSTHASADQTTPQVLVQVASPGEAPAPYHTRLAEGFLTPPRLAPKRTQTQPHLHLNTSFSPVPSTSSPGSILKRSHTAGSTSVASGGVPNAVSSGASPAINKNRTLLRSKSALTSSQELKAMHNPIDSQILATTASAEQQFEDSVQAQADQIRRERQERKEKEFRRGPRRGSRTQEEAALEHAKLASALSAAAAAAAASAAQADDRPLVGNLIGEDHVNYVLMYNMLTGIRIGVSRCQAKILRPLTDEDYTAKHKFSFDMIGNELTPSARYDFKFKDYAPWVFRELREHFLLDPADYLVSLTAKYILSELGSPGKSGSFFYFSRDYRFIIKTIHKSEHKFLRRILKRYHDHVKANPHTLISRFYGLHRVKLPHGRKIHFVTMNNLMPPHRDIHETFDLKGSTVSREYPEEKLATNPGATLKDLNWIHRHRQLHLGPEKRALFLEQLKQDTELLKKLGIMDYSLLIGIHDLTRGNSEKLREGALTMFDPDTNKQLLRRRQTNAAKRDRDADAIREAVKRSDPVALSENNHLPDKDRSERRYFIFYQDEGGLRATDPDNQPIDTIYYMGVIDILTPYRVKKFAENFFKGLVHDKHAISPVPPKEYGNRFLKFMTSIVAHGDNTEGTDVAEVEPKPP